jgi:hypothetical protein
MRDGEFRRGIRLSSKVGFIEMVLSVVKKNPARGAGKHDPKKSICNDSCGSGHRLGSDGQSDPGFDLAALDQSAIATLPNSPPASSFVLLPTMPSL